MERQSSLARTALSIFVDQKQLSAKIDLDQREEEKIILDEAKRAAPVVFAKQGVIYLHGSVLIGIIVIPVMSMYVLLNILEGMTHHRDISPHRDGLKLPS